MHNTALRRELGPDIYDEYKATINEVYWEDAIMREQLEFARIAGYAVQRKAEYELEMSFREASL